MVNLIKTQLSLTPKAIVPSCHYCHSLLKDAAVMQYAFLLAWGCDILRSRVTPNFPDKGSKIS